MARAKLVLAVVIGGMLLTGISAMVMAQQAENRRDRGGRERPDPAQMRQRMMDQFKERLGAADDEWQVIQPKLERLMAVSQQSRGGGFGFGGFGGRGPAARPGRDRQPESPVAKASMELRTALDNKDTSASEIQKKLTALREAREQAKTELAKAQKELKDLLTQRQEAMLVMMGMLE